MIFCVSHEKYHYISGYKDPYRDTYIFNEFSSLVKDDVEYVFLFSDALFLGGDAGVEPSVVEVYIRRDSTLSGGHRVLCRPDAYEVLLSAIKILSSQIGTVFGYVISDLMAFILEKKEVHFSCVDAPFSVQAFLSGLKTERIKEAHYLSTIDLHTTFDEFADFDHSFKDILKLDSQVRGSFGMGDLDFTGCFYSYK